MKRRYLLSGMAAALALAVAGGALAQTAPFPSKTVTLIVPYSPGGLPDTVARFVGQKLAEKWGQSVVVENKPGGNGVVAAEALAAKPADGYTLLVTDGTMFSVNPFIYPSLRYDAVKDFTYISLTARAPLFLAVHPSMPAGNFAEFVQLVKASPGKYSYGSSGIGSIHHLTFETIKSALGIDILHVPYKGTGQSIPALVSGDVTAVWSAMPSIAGFTKEGKLKLIAVNSAKRSELAPNVATVAETHIPGFDFAPIIGFIGPAGVPPAIAQKVSADVAEVVKDKALVERMTALGIEAVGSDPQTFQSQIMADRERFSRAIKAADIKPQ
jgi:tripartite-type tricarboxylate transporter receptor subunit TctC